MSDPATLARRMIAKLLEFGMANGCRPVAYSIDLAWNRVGLGFRFEPHRLHGVKLTTLQSAKVAVELRRLLAERRIPERGILA